MDDVLGDRGRRAPARFLVKVLIAASAVVGLAAGGAVMTDDDLASFPSWLEAVATTAALLAALFAARYAANAWRLEQFRESRRDLRKLQAQAQLIAAWVAELPTIVNYGRREAMPIEYFVRNASDVPVTNVRIAFTLRVLDRSGSTFLEVGTVDRAVVPPAPEPHAAGAPVAVIQAVQSILDSGVEPGSITVLAGISFTDAGGHHWIREPNGRLVEPPELLTQLRQHTAIF